ncbi:helix-turn-helix transcriptional regulator [Streptomyces sp. NPDC048506]|uniref:helix-turn-helix transcriptional regulator n=1 Tax=Streptomyces sp. NPDC048506 TaxID=3155028 RepID=UPI0034181121
MTTASHVPNNKLRAVRIGLRLSQDDLARALRGAGAEAGEPNDASKRLVQRWETGVSRSPRPVYARALEKVTGMPIEALGFRLPLPMARVRGDGRGGHDMEPSPDGIPAASSSRPQPATEGPEASDTSTGSPAPNHSGIWLSRYEFFSSGRDATFSAAHHVVLVQHGTHLTGHSLPGASSNPDSPLSLDLTMDGNVVTGTWVEQTASSGYYAGARYHGAVQLLVEPTGRRMAGKWVGFGKDFDVNTGPWELVFKDLSMSKATLDDYSRPPE